MIELVAVDIDQRVLVLGLRNPRADRNVLRGLHVQGDAPDRLQRLVQARDHLVDADVLWPSGFNVMNTRPSFSVTVGPPGPI